MGDKEDDDDQIVRDQLCSISILSYLQASIPDWQYLQMNNWTSFLIYLQSFFGRTYNNLSSISECKNNGECVINKKNRTACKACRLRKCLLVGMSKSGSRYGRRSNWFKIHCLLQEQQQQKNGQSATSGGGITETGTGQIGIGGGGGTGPGGGRNRGLFMDASGMDKNMEQYLQHFGGNAVNAFRIRNNNNNNNNNFESKYNFYDEQRLDYVKRSSSSKTDEEEEDNSNQSSSIVVDEDSQPNRDESSPSLDSQNQMQELHNRNHNQLPLNMSSLLHHNHHPQNNNNNGPLFRPGIEPMSPFSQKYHDFFLSPFLQSVTTSLKRPSTDPHFEVNSQLVVDQDTPIDLSIKSKISRITSGSAGAVGMNQNRGVGISIAATATETDRLKSAGEMEKKNPLDLSLLPPRCVLG